MNEFYVLLNSSKRKQVHSKLDMSKHGQFRKFIDINYRKNNFHKKKEYRKYTTKKNIYYWLLLTLINHKIIV